jgi:hypothetical protein
MTIRRRCVAVALELASLVIEKPHERRITSSEISIRAYRLRSKACRAVPSGSFAG